MKVENRKDKKTISKRVHQMMNEGRYEETERILLGYLESGDRSTIILGSLINLYKRQGEKWEQIESLAREYLELKPKNSFAKDSLELAQRKQNKSKESVIPQSSQVIKPPRQEISNFRKKVHEGIITVQNISEEQLEGFASFERSILLAELYSYANLNEKAVDLLMKAAQSEGITPNEQTIIRQAIQLVKSSKKNNFKKRIQWNTLPLDERSKLFGISSKKQRHNEACQEKVQEVE